MNVLGLLIKAVVGIVLALVLAFGLGYVSQFLFTPHIPAQPGFEVVVLAEGETAAQPREVPIEELFATASIEKGEKVAKKCAACHNFKEGQGNKVGPELYGVVGRETATFPGFKYTDAMKAHGGKWDALALNTYLTNPKEVVPGTSMAFAGIRKAEDRANLIAYLNSLSHDPQPLPTAAPAEEEAPAEDAPAQDAAPAEAAPAEAAPADATPAESANEQQAPAVAN
ncbi:c-type cytochrome [Xanthobacter sp. TB0139]|uniref:c-type cytochrome n=1 Tax=Xanthobacter sp. TB0139 TaxID=3459178 RepID=UPI004039207E